MGRRPQTAGTLRQELPAKGSESLAVPLAHGGNGPARRDPFLLSPGCPAVNDLDGGEPERREQVLNRIKGCALVAKLGIDPLRVFGPDWKQLGDDANRERG